MNAGLAKLIARAQEHVSDLLASAADGYPGDSEIEKLFAQALGAYRYVAGSQWNVDYVLFPRTPEELKRALEERDTVTIGLIVASQVEMPFGRVDFIVHAWDFEKERWRRLIVECDGHAFHERTKEQAAKDRSRDRQAQMAGHEIFRFTGSELWRDAWGCAEQVFEWAAKSI